MNNARMCILCHIVELIHFHLFLSPFNYYILLFKKLSVAKNLVQLHFEQYFIQQTPEILERRL